MRLLSLILALAISAAAQGGKILTPIMSPSSAPAGGTGTWALKHAGVQNTCSGSGTSISCSATVTSTTAGSILVACATFLGAPTPVTAMAGDSTWTHATNTYLSVANDGNGSHTTDCYYILSATGGATTITASATYGSFFTYVDIFVSEFTYTSGGGAPTFDVGNNADDGGGCTTCAGPSLSITGTDDLIIQVANGWDEAATAISGTYTNPKLLDSSYPHGAMAGSLNVSSYSAPNWTFSGNTKGKIVAAFALKGN